MYNLKYIWSRIPNLGTILLCKNAEFRCMPDGVIGRGHCLSSTVAILIVFLEKYNGGTILFLMVLFIYMFCVILQIKLFPVISLYCILKSFNTRRYD